ncbi:melatonin receptor type 1C-like [Mytilus trossulus]|uniref:melatonin receptor type 1C-like n=1 Tax=Mytilus trossulus TaxID=6551 RepID=UPI003003FAD2
MGNNKTLTGRTKYEDITAEQFIEGILLTIICIVAVLGNISIWIIVLRSRALRTITNCFLLVLSAFDLLVSVINIPVTIATIFSGEWLLSDDACEVLGFSNMVTLCGSVLSLCNISINRYVMVCHPSKFIEVYKRKNVAIMIVAAIGVTIGVSMPPLIGWCEYSYTPAQYICFANWPMSLSYSLFMICCCFGVPLVVMIFCNYKIYRIVKTSKNKIMNNYTVKMSMSKDETDITQSDNICHQDIGKEQNQHTGIGNQDLNREPQLDDNKGNRTLSVSFKIKISPPKQPVYKASKAKPEEIRLAIMLGTIVVVFFVCWFPYRISMILSILMQQRL